MAFFDALLGKGGPSPNDTYAEQEAALRRGRKRATDRYETGRDTAIGYVKPYMEGGQRGQALYESSLGVTDPQLAFDTWQRDPFRAESEATANRALDRRFASYNSRGFADSGLSRLGIARASQDMYDERLKDWRNRLAGLGQQGLGASQFAGETAFGTGKLLGDLDWGYGQQKAGLMGYRDNALRQQSSTGINNLLKIGEIGGKVAAAFISDRRMKRDIVRVGELPSGLPVYRFRYQWSEVPHVGVMAQDALAIVPEAVIERADGVLMVDYSKVR